MRVRVIQVRVCA
jgi:hypothetical protein